MHSGHETNSSNFFWLLAAIASGVLIGGCATVGPATINNGRLSYNEAIIATDNQQILMLAVHSRYEERGNLLAVSSVTANVRVRTSASVELGFGDESNYAGNLVPFGATAMYEENPTISYTPVGGAKYMRQLFAPIPVNILAELASGMTNPAPLFTALLSSVNGIYNPDFLTTTVEPDPRFARLVTLMDTLATAHRIHWIRDPNASVSTSIVIDRSSPGFDNEIGELLSLLGLTVINDDTQFVVLPVALALVGRQSDGIAITTRSVWDLLEILSAAIDVPEDDRRNNVAASYPPPGLPGSALRVHLADSKPDKAYVAVEHRGHWFYIDESDQATKRFFRLVGALFSVVIAESAADISSAPVLTVPVSR